MASPPDSGLFGPRKVPVLTRLYASHSGKADHQNPRDCGVLCQHIHYHIPHCECSVLVERWIWSEQPGIVAPNIWTIIRCLHG